MPNPATKSKFNTNQWFCIGMSGHTADGREIKSEWLIQAAEDYNPAKYGARINVEHYRSMYPGSELAGYGDVTALKTETDGSITKLYAQINPTEKLVALNQAREKIYTSMELHTNFAQSQRAYLTGLAITDSPASLGTTALQFSIDANSPFSIKPEFFISEPLAMTDKNKETEVKIDPVAEEKAPNWFARLFSEAAPKQQESVNDTALQELRIQTEQGFKAASEETKALREEVKKLTDQLQKQPVSAPQQLHVGANSTVQHKPADY